MRCAGDRTRGSKPMKMGTSRIKTLKEKACDALDPIKQGVPAKLRGRAIIHRHIGAMDVGAVKAPTIQRSEPCRRSRHGLDIAKSVFQVHGVDACGQVIVRRQLKRRYVLTFFHKLSPCLSGIEACGSSHHWSRELQALGHTVRLIRPAYVKPYVKRQKNDATDAEAICEAVTRANMRPGAPPFPPSVHPPADLGDQCNPGPSSRVRDRCAGRARRPTFARYGQPRWSTHPSRPAGERTGGLR
jgi:hypothetical protein